MTKGAKKLSRRSFLRSAAVAATGAAIAACQPQTVIVEKEKEVTTVVEKQVEVEKVVTATAPPPLSATVRWGSWAVGSAFFEALANQFMEKEPDIKIQIEAAPWSQYWDRMQVQMAAGESADVLWMSGAMFLNFVQKGFFMDMTPLVEAENLNIEDFFLQADVFTYEGKVYAWPWFHTVSSCWYNKELFDEAGVAYPPTEWDQAWTWDEFLETAQQLTKVRPDGRQQYGAHVHEAFEQCWGSFVWSNGGDVMNADKTKSTMNTPEAIEAIQYLVDLVREYKVAPEPGDPSVFIEGAPTPFEAGLVAMHVHSSAMATSYQEIEAFTPCACVLPQAPGGTPCCSFNGNPNSIPESSKVKEAAWKFVTFLSSQEGMESMALQKLGMPANKSVCYRADLYLKPPPYNLEVFANAMNIACCNDLRFVRLWLEWVNAVQAPVTLALLGEMSVEEACAKIDEDCDEVLMRS